MGTISFRHLYDWDASTDHRVMRSKSYLVARVSTATPAAGTKVLESESLPVLEDLLLLAGFASRIPTRCAGWIASDRRNRVHYFRRQLRLPAGEQRHETIVNGGMVELGDFERFLNACIVPLRASTYLLHMRSAFYALENARRHSVERKLVSLFSAFEGLVNEITAKRSSERFSVDRPLRKQATERVKAVFDGWVDDGSLTAEVGAQLMVQLGKAQSISRREQYRLLQEAVPFEMEDLWPLVGRKGVKSLYDIRNAIAHGSAMSPSRFHALVAAGHHIEWLLERLICAILGWSLEDTDLSSSELRSYWLSQTCDWRLAEKGFGE
ncbi:HEPN domain-containing protein [Usitatibacter rugosus]|uniref:HEPN domain-containing protein n=1 Tax=Usitatibacter rugosus TaxID=2732067 RepID=UPI001489CF89|nr:HEPN domain-containing protein [Usitatibacter rugosus]